MDESVSHNLNQPPNRILWPSQRIADLESQRSHKSSVSDTTCKSSWLADSVRRITASHALTLSTRQRRKKTFVLGGILLQYFHSCHILVFIPLYIVRPDQALIRSLHDPLAHEHSRPTAQQVP
jgi:hypothetical protein